MMKRFATFILFAMLSLATSTAQEFVQAAIGASYANQAFYNLHTNAVSTLANEAWDLAFSTRPGDGGIFVNESTRSAMSGAGPQLELFLAPTGNFADIVYPDAVADSLYNDEVSWQNGAFNNPRDMQDPNDYGWGRYNAATQAVEGGRVFALKFRDNSWKKIFIESMANGVFTVKYAGLDGANENTITIDKGDYGSSPLALFSFVNGTVMASPADWDLLFTRYFTALDPGDGQIVQYPVTGVLSGPGVEVAEARDVDPLDVNYEPYLDSLDSRLDIIGQDWKSFDLGSFTWVLDPNRAFFVKTTENRLWKLVFYGFDGSSTGIFTFEKTDLGLLSALEETSGNVADWGLFPNPASGELTFSFSLKESRKSLPLFLTNAFGQIVWRSKVPANEGLNVVNLRLQGLPAGMYQLNLGSGDSMLAAKVVLR